MTFAFLLFKFHPHHSTHADTGRGYPVKKTHTQYEALEKNIICPTNTIVQRYIFKKKIVRKSDFVCKTRFRSDVESITRDTRTLDDGFASESYKKLNKTDLDGQFLRFKRSERTFGEKDDFARALGNIERSNFRKTRHKQKKKTKATLRYKTS